LFCNRLNDGFLHWKTDVNVSRGHFVQDICEPSSCLHHPLVALRDTAVTTYLLYLITF